MLGTGNAINITVEQPFDWVGSVVVPVAAILVSSAIAVVLAAIERRRGEQARRKDAIVASIMAITHMSRVVANHRSAGADIDATFADVAAELNGLAALLSVKESYVPRFAMIVLHKASTTSNREPIVNACLYVTTALESWARGAVKARAFEDAIPDDAEHLWASEVDLAKWAGVVDGSVGPTDWVVT